MFSNKLILNTIVVVSILFISHPSWCKSFVAFEVDKADQEFQSSLWKKVKRMNGDTMGTVGNLDAFRPIITKPELSDTDGAIIDDDNNFTTQNSNDAGSDSGNSYGETSNWIATVMIVR